MDLTQLTIYEAGKSLRKREISVQELTNAYLEKIEKFDKVAGAYITVCKEKAREQAALVQKKFDSKAELSPLAGIPMSIKDNIFTKGILTSCASKILSNYIPQYDATVVKKLYDNDSILLGKVNMDEFAMGSSTENSWYGPTKNPWDPERVPGGSSGGSAASVSAGMACFSLGTDTGGSVRQPASFCGVIGLKPTYGSVSHYGMVALAPSFDQIGPVTRSTADCALVLNAIAGHDLNDSNTFRVIHPDYTCFLKEDIRGLRIGIPREFIHEELCDDVKEKVMEAVGFFEANDCIVREVSLPTTEYALPAYYILSCAEACSSLAMFARAEYGYLSDRHNGLTGLHSETGSESFGMEAKRRILIGTYVLSREHYDTYFKRAQKVRRMVFDDYQKAFGDVDLIIGPAEVCTAYKLGTNASKPLKLNIGDIYTVSVNMTGNCALSIPCGKDRKGLPIGMQLIGKHFDEGTLLRAAYAYEKSTGGIGMPNLK